MATRKFYINAEIEGRNTPLAAGPTGDKGFFMTILMSPTGQHGSLMAKVTVTGTVATDGTLTLSVRLPDSDDGGVVTMPDPNDTYNRIVTVTVNPTETRR